MGRNSKIKIDSRQAEYMVTASFVRICVPKNPYEIRDGWKEKTNLAVEKILFLCYTECYDRIIGPGGQHRIVGCGNC